MTLSTWEKPLRGFDASDCVSASIWLIFLGFPAMALVAGGSTLAGLLVGVACLVGFSAVYSFSFGAMSYYPRGWAAWQRYALYTSLLLVCVGLSLPVLSSFAVCFLPYLCAHHSFRMPWRITVPVCAALLLLSVAGAWACTPDRLLMVVGYGVSSVPVVGLGLLSQRQEQRSSLTHQLEMAEERERIAQDVHDLLGHSLTVINLKAEVAKRTDDAHTAARELDDISRLTRTALAEVRSTVTHLRSPSIDDALVAMRRALETAGITHHVPEHADVGTNEALFTWVLKEATTNILQHAQASAVHVTMTADRLQIDDDGVGIPASVSSHGNGLRGIRERVAASGGTAIVEPSAQGRGTRIFISMSADHERFGLP